MRNTGFVLNQSSRPSIVLVSIAVLEVVDCRVIDFCITQLKAQGPSRICNESKEEEEIAASTSSGGQPLGGVASTGP